MRLKIRKAGQIRQCYPFHEFLLRVKYNMPMEDMVRCQSIALVVAAMVCNLHLVAARLAETHP
jgi:hypothetical protein